MIICTRCKKSLKDFPICRSIIGVSNETDFVGCCKGENVCKICGKKMNRRRLKNELR